MTTQERAAEIDKLMALADGYADANAECSRDVLLPKHVSEQRKARATLRAALEAALDLGEPVAFITDESLRALKLGGNGSRGSVPVHAESSAVAKTPVYAPKEPA